MKPTYFIALDGGELPFRYKQKDKSVELRNLFDNLRGDAPLVWEYIPYEGSKVLVMQVRPRDSPNFWSSEQQSLDYVFIAGVIKRSLGDAYKEGLIPFSTDVPCWTLQTDITEKQKQDLELLIKYAKFDGGTKFYGDILFGDTVRRLLNIE